MNSIIHENQRRLEKLIFFSFCLYLWRNRQKPEEPSGKWVTNQNWQEAEFPGNVSHLSTITVRRRWVLHSELSITLIRPNRFWQSSHSSADTLGLLLSVDILIFLQTSITNIWMFIAVWFVLIKKKILAYSKFVAQRICQWLNVYIMRASDKFIDDWTTTSDLLGNKSLLARLYLDSNTQTKTKKMHMYPSDVSSFLPLQEKKSCQELWLPSLEASASIS